MKKVSSFLILVPVLLLLVACFNEKPEIPEETYIRLLAEIELAQVVLIQTHDTELVNLIMEKIWESYGVTREDFMQSHKIYESDPFGQEKRIEKAADILTEEHNRLDVLIREKREQLRIEAALKDSLNSDTPIGETSFEP